MIVHCIQHGTYAVRSSLFVKHAPHIWQFTGRFLFAVIAFNVGSMVRYPFAEVSACILCWCYLAEISGGYSLVFDDDGDDDGENHSLISLLPGVPGHHFLFHVPLQCNDDENMKQYFFYSS